MEKSPEAEQRNDSITLLHWESRHAHPQAPLPSIIKSNALSLTPGPAHTWPSFISVLKADIC